MIEIDLLPESLRRREGAGAEATFIARVARLDLVSLALWVSMFTVPPAVLSVWWTQRVEAGELEARLEAASTDSANLAELRSASDSLAQRVREIGDRVALVERLDRDRFAWPRMMDEIGRALPSLAWLTSLRQVSAPPGLVIELQGVAAKPLAITHFVQSLGASDHIADVRIIGSQQQAHDPGDGSRQAFTLILRSAVGAGGGRVAPIVQADGRRQ